MEVKLLTSPVARREHPIFTAYLEAFADYEPLRQLVLLVSNQLPAHVQNDFLDDPRFRVTLDIQ